MTPAVRGDDALSATCHKLRTPLTAALGFVQLAQREARQEGKDSRLHQNLEMVEEQLRRIAGMLDELAGIAQTQ